MSATNAFASTPRIGCARVTAASTNLQTPGAPVQLFVAGANGSVLQRISIIAGQTTTAGMIHFFWYDGTNYRYWKSVKVDAITVAAGTAPFQSELLFPEGVPMPSSSGGTLFDELVVATHVAETFDIIAFGGDL